MDLLRNYPAGYNVLPTANPHDVVNVSLQLALYHLVDMVRPPTPAESPRDFLERAGPDPDHQLRDHHQVAGRLPDVGPGPLRQHHGHPAAVAAGLDPGHRPLQRRGRRGAGQGDEDSHPGRHGLEANLSFCS